VLHRCNGGYQPANTGGASASREPEGITSTGRASVQRSGRGAKKNFPPVARRFQSKTGVARARYQRYRTGVTSFGSDQGHAQQYSYPNRANVRGRPPDRPSIASFDLGRSRAGSRSARGVRGVLGARGNRSDVGAGNNAGRLTDRGDILSVLDR